MSEKGRVKRLLHVTLQVRWRQMSEKGRVKRLLHVTLQVSYYAS